MRNWEGGWGNEGYEGERVMRERGGGMRGMYGGMRDSVRDMREGGMHGGMREGGMHGGMREGGMHGGMREGGMHGGMREGGMRDWPERGMREWGSMRERGWDFRGGRDEQRGFRDDGMRGRMLRGEDDLSAQEGEAPIVKVLEVVAQSPHSWEDAARRAVAEASRTIHDIKSVWVKDMQAIVSRDRIVEFRLVAKISFAIHPEQRHQRDRYA